MRIKRYVASSVEEALREVKADLGHHAIILQTRRRRALLGLLGGARFEVVAAVDPTLRVAADGLRRQAIDDGRQRERPARVRGTAPIPVPSAAVRAYGVSNAVVVEQTAEQPTEQPAEQPVASTPQPGVSTVQPVDDRSAPARAPVGEAEPVSYAEPVLFRLQPAVETTDFGDLLACGLQPDTAETLLAGGVRIGSEAFRDRLRQLIQRRFRRGATASPAKRARVVALVGPTGSGKTTTLAKLAARAALLEGRRVALITLDTYRIGAVDQLQAYAEILEAPFHVAYTGKDLKQAVDEAAAADLVLIDTAGRGPRDALALSQVRQAFREVRVDEVHLVLTASTRLVDARRIWASYQALAPNRLLFTKLDETPALGGLVEIPRLAPLPVSHLAFGQRVPDDLEPALPERALERFLAGLDEIREGRCG